MSSDEEAHSPDIVNEDEGAALCALAGCHDWEYQCDFGTADRVTATCARCGESVDTGRRDHGWTPGNFPQQRDVRLSPAHLLGLPCRSDEERHPNEAEPHRQP